MAKLSKSYTDGLLKPAIESLNAEAEAKTKAARAATHPASSTYPASYSATGSLYFAGLSDVDN